MKYLVIISLVLFSCNNSVKQQPVEIEQKSIQYDTLASTPITPTIKNQYYAFTGLIKNSDKAITLIYFDQYNNTGYFINRDECSSQSNKVNFTYSISGNTATITVVNKQDYQFPSKVEFLDGNLKVLSINEFKYSENEYSYYSPCSMRGPNPNFYELELTNSIQIGNLIPSTSQSNFNDLMYTDIKSLTIKNNIKDAQNKFLEDYNNKHTCSDQRSFDAGYDLARQQYGVTIDIDLPDYLYKISVNLGYDYNSYCFKNGVTQYINDKQN